MQWDRRFFASTRGRLVALLRQGGRTVDELAARLDLTDNAVRAHLAALERDGLAQQDGERRGGGKPAYLYGLTPEAEALFPKAYEPALRQLLETLNERMPPEDVEAVLRAAGRGLAARQPRAEVGDTRARLATAVDALNALGGLAELEEREVGFVIRSQSCPLAAVVPGHPEVCRLAEALVTEVSGVAVRECCDRAAPPRCRFETASAEVQPAEAPRAAH